MSEQSEIPTAQQAAQWADEEAADERARHAHESSSGQIPDDADLDRLSDGD